MKIYSVCGFKGSGKDSFAKFFKDLGFKKINFADNLKEMCIYTFELPREPFFATINEKEALFDVPIVLSVQHINKLNEWIHKTHPFDLSFTHVGKEFKNIRSILQYVGTEMIRSVYMGYHTEVTLVEMQKYERVICADVRFKNELDGMKQLAEDKNYIFKSFYIRRPGYGGDSHASEVDITPDDVDYIVENDTTIENLLKIANLFI